MIHDNGMSLPAATGSNTGFDGTTQYVRLLPVNPRRIALEIENNHATANIYIADRDSTGIDTCAKKFPPGHVRRWDVAGTVHQGEVWGRADVAGAFITITETVAR